MESEKVKEILEIFANDNEPDGTTRICREALVLINELESENTKLTKAVVDNLDAYRDGFNAGASLKDRVDNKLKTENQQLKDRIAELEKENSYLTEECQNLNGLLMNKKRETATTEWKLKRFAERLKEKMPIHYPSTIEAIDETLKEFIND